MENSYALDFVKVVEQAAIGCAREMGRGDRKYADHVATECMRSAMDSIEMRGTIVIGEGERDEAPMLYIGEKVGRGYPNDMEIDIAVDPLEGTNLCATGSPNAITVLAASEKGGLLNAPDIYMDKIVVGPVAKGKVDINASVADNLNAIAKAYGRDVKDLVVIVLDRPRHEKLITDIRKAGARIKLIGDGDLSAGISASVQGTGVHAVMGIGGSPEGVLKAAALKCLGGEIQAKFAIRNDAEEQRLENMGVKAGKVLFTDDLAPGKNIVFAATGVTGGELLKGVRFFGGGCRTNTLIMSYKQHTLRFLDSIHIFEEGRSIIRL